MATPAQPDGLIRFGSFELDAANGELRRAGVTVRMHPQPLQVLVLLMERAGQTVTREEIRHCLWGDNTFVDFERGINFCINQVRSALGDDAAKPRYIETHPRRGYRFIAPVTAAIEPTTFPGAFDSLAVLPLLNATGDSETEYLSDGISESLINLLSQLPNLRVIPRTSTFRYKIREANLKAIARDLKVRTILTGKMTKLGDRVVVQTELVDVACNAQIWGGRFNRKLDDIFEVQEELARQICENLRLRLTPEEGKRLAKRPTQNREAYHCLLKAQYHLNNPAREGFKRGLVYARQAVEVDPGYAEAYAWMSAAYSWLGLFDFLPPAEAFPKAKAAAQKALEIDDTLAESHAALGIVRMYYEWDWAGAAAALRRALDVNPGYAWGHAVWSDWLTVMGRLEEALAEENLAVELDPLSASLNARLGAKFGLRGDYDRALQQLQRALEFDPNFVFTNVILARTYCRKGMCREALATCRKVLSLCRSKPLSRALSSVALAMSGKTDEVREILSELKGNQKLDSWSLTLLAETCNVMGEKAEAFEFLEAAYQQRGSWLIFVDVIPGFRNLRTDARFLDLLRRMGLPRMLPQPVSL